MLEKIFGPLTSRWAWARTALDVQKRFGELKGNYLASAVTLNLFLSVFPLLLVAIAVVGFLTSGDTDIGKQIISQLALDPSQAETMNQTLDTAASTKKAASVIGLIGLLWSGLGAVAAIEYALDSTWQVTGRGIKDKLTGLTWLGGALIIVGASIAITTLARIVASGVTLDLVTTVVALIVDFGFWMWTFVILSFRRVTWRAYVPGAIFAAIGLEAIKQIASFLPSLLSGSSALYGTLSAAFAILTTLFLFGRILVYASVLNVVKWEGDHGTVTLDIEVPKVPGAVPLEADRHGASEPPDSSS